MVWNKINQSICLYSKMLDKRSILVRRKRAECFLGLALAGVGQLKFSWLEQSAVRDGSRKRELFWNCFCKLAAVVWAFWIFQRGKKGELRAKANILCSGQEVGRNNADAWTYPVHSGKFLVFQFLSHLSTSVSTFGALLDSGTILGHFIYWWKSLLSYSEWELKFTFTSVCYGTGR